jgi:hypothetical protein
MTNMHYGLLSFVARHDGVTAKPVCSEAPAIPTSGGDDVVTISFVNDLLDSCLRLCSDGEAVSRELKDSIAAAVCKSSGLQAPAAFPRVSELAVQTRVASVSYAGDADFESRLTRRTLARQYGVALMTVHAEVEFAVGDYVKVSAIHSRPELNGKVVKVVEFLNNGRVAVELAVSFSTAVERVSLPIHALHKGLFGS